MQIGTLVLNRFNGVEIFAVKYPSIKVIQNDDSFELLLYIDTKVKPIQTLPDTEEWAGHPNAEVYISLKKLDLSKLVGRQFSIPKSWDDEKEDHVSCLYYFDHQDLDKNVVRFLQRKGSKFLVHWTGITEDVNAGSGKPETEVEIKAWFNFENFRKWSKVKTL